MQNGKGDSRRPVSVDIVTFKENWDLVFNKKDKPSKNKKKKDKNVKST